jgi:hypothetical protein
VPPRDERSLVDANVPRVVDRAVVQENNKPKHKPDPPIPLYPLHPMVEDLTGHRAKLELAVRAEGRTLEGDKAGRAESNHVPHIGAPSVEEFSRSDRLTSGSELCSQSVATGGRACHGICPQSVGQARHGEACASGGAEGADSTLGHAVGGRGIRGGDHIGRQPQIQQTLLKLGGVELSTTISV